MRKTNGNLLTQDTKQDNLVFNTTMRGENTMKTNNTPIKPSDALKDFFNTYDNLPLLEKLSIDNRVQRAERLHLSVMTFINTDANQAVYDACKHDINEYRGKIRFTVRNEKLKADNENRLYTYEDNRRFFYNEMLSRIAEKAKKEDDILTESIREEERKNKAVYTYDACKNGMDIFNIMLTSGYFTGIVKGAIKSIARRSFENNKGLRMSSEVCQKLIYTGYSMGIYEDIYQDIALLLSSWLCGNDWKEYISITDDKKSIVFNHYQKTTTDKEGNIKTEEKSYFIHIMRSVENTIRHSKKVNCDYATKQGKEREEREEKKTRERLESIRGKYNGDPLDTITECEKVQDLFSYIDKVYPKHADNMKEIVSLKALGYKQYEISSITGLSADRIKKLSVKCNECIHVFAENNKEERKAKKAKKAKKAEKTA